MPHINNKQLNKNIRNYIKHSKLRERTNRQARFIPEALLLLVYHRHKFDHHCCAVPSHPHPYPSLPSHTRTQSYIPPPPHPHPLSLFVPHESRTGVVRSRHSGEDVVQAPVGRQSLVEGVLQTQVQLLRVADLQGLREVAGAGEGRHVRTAPRQLGPAARLAVHQHLHPVRARRQLCGPSAIHHHTFLFP